MDLYPQVVNAAVALQNTESMLLVIGITDNLGSDGDTLTTNLLQWNNVVSIFVVDQVTEMFILT